MKTLQQHISEKLVLTNNSKIRKTIELIEVKTNKELRNIVRERYLKNQKELNLTDLDVSEIHNFECIFYELSKIEIIDISGWNTSKARNFINCFAECTNLKEIIGIEDLDTSNVVEFTNMFCVCESLEKLDVSKWNTQNVDSITGFVKHCKKLKTIKGLENWDYKKLEWVNGAFADCPVLDNIDLSSWDFLQCPKIHFRTAHEMFEKSPKLQDKTKWPKHSYNE
jgi:surface protein